MRLGFLIPLMKWMGIVLLGCLITAGIFFWSGLWGVYSIPPSKSSPEGETWVVSRAEDEPLFNAPDRYIPPPPPTAPQPHGGIGVQRTRKYVKPIHERIIFKLPFIAYAYEQVNRDTTKRAPATR